MPLVFSASGWSDEPKLEETVVVASRISDRIDRLGVSGNLIDRAEIESHGYPDVASLLDTQTGVGITTNGAFSKAASARIRGEEGFRTRVLLDGINIADPSSSQISLRMEHLLTNGLSKIEVLRGPSGLVWGADAGGVILLSTISDATEREFTASLEGGSDGYNRATAN